MHLNLPLARKRAVSTAAHTDEQADAIHCLPAVVENIVVLSCRPTASKLRRNISLGFAARSRNGKGQPGSKASSISVDEEQGADDDKAAELAHSKSGRLTMKEGRVEGENYSITLTCAF